MGRTRERRNWIQCPCRRRRSRGCLSMPMGFPRVRSSHVAGSPRCRASDDPSPPCVAPLGPASPAPPARRRVPCHTGAIHIHRLHHGVGRTHTQLGMKIAASDRAPGASTRFPKQRAECADTQRHISTAVSATAGQIACARARAKAASPGRAGACVRAVRHSAHTRGRGRRVRRVGLGSRASVGAGLGPLLRRVSRLPPAADGRAACSSGRDADGVRPHGQAGSGLTAAGRALGALADRRRRGLLDDDAALTRRVRAGGPRSGPPGRCEHLLRRRQVLVRALPRVQALQGDHVPLVLVRPRPDLQHAPRDEAGRRAGEAGSGGCRGAEGAAAPRAPVQPLPH